MLLTTDENGAAANSVTLGDADYIPVLARRRYSFRWFKSTAASPSQGTLAVKLKVEGDSTPQNFLDSEGSIISYDLSAVLQGGFEFTPGFNGAIEISISGGEEDQSIHYNVTDIDT